MKSVQVGNVPSKEIGSHFAANAAITARLVSQFVATALQTGKEFDTAQLDQKAREFFVGHSDGLQRNHHPEVPYGSIIKELEALQPTLNQELLSTLSSGVMDPQNKVCSEVHQRLDPFRKLLGQISSPATALTPEALFKETDRLIEIATQEQEKVALQSRRLEDEFCLAVSRAYEAGIAAHQLEDLARRLAQQSSYYPSRKSPEAHAIKRGLLRVTGDAGALQRLGEVYLRLDLEASELSSSVDTFQAPTQAGAGAHTNAYFNKLLDLKRELLFAPQEQLVPTLQKLRDTYVQSGSIALSYFSSLDCLAAGDYSHQTLTIAGDAALTLSLSAEFQDTLRLLLDSADPDPAIALHLLRNPADLKMKPAEVTQLRAILDMFPDTAEYGLARATESLKNGYSDMARDQGLSAYAIAKVSNGPLASASLEIALQAIMSSSPAQGPCSSAVTMLSKKILRCEPENLMAWDTLISHGSPLCTVAGDWTEIDKLLQSYPSERGYLRAAEWAKETGDPQRAESYLQEAVNGSIGSTETQLALAKLFEERGDEKAMYECLKQAAELSPHHSGITFPVEYGSVASLPARVTVMPVPIDPSEWTEEIRNQIIEAARGKNQFKSNLEEVCSEYAFVKMLLNQRSDLYKYHQETRTQLNNYLQDITLLLAQKSVTAVQWLKAAATMHQELNPLGYKSALCHFRNTLRELGDAVTSLDRSDHHLGVLKQVPTLDAHVENSREAWVVCTEKIEAKKPAAEIREALEALQHTLVRLDGVVANDIGKRLIAGSYVVDRWTGSVEETAKQLISGTPGQGGKGKRSDSGALL
jgi:hypothetical protein